MGEYKRENVLENIALSVLKNHDGRLLQGEPKATPIEEIVEFDYGLYIKYYNLSINGSIHGITIFKDTELSIFNNKNKDFECINEKAGTIVLDNMLTNINMEKRLRFTLAHELAHWILHLECSREISEKEMEREADNLATAILMPRGRVKIAYNRLRGFCKNEVIVARLSEMFNVSNKAMEIRLLRLKLLDYSGEFV